MSNEHNEESLVGRYKRAQQLLQGYWRRTIVANSTVYPIWIEGSECFWYEREINVEKNIRNKNDLLQPWDREYRLVNAKNETNEVAFDHNALAATLQELTGEEISSSRLPITELKMVLDSAGSVEKLRFNSFEKHWVYDIQSSKLTGSQTSPERSRLPNRTSSGCSVNENYGD